MRKSTSLLILTAVALCVFLTAAALSDSPLAALWDSGCDLLFHTDNVTVTGEATFSLDGERFKTAKLNYVQDGFRSVYDLSLLTPRANGTERETGWTIVADDDGYYYVMEVYTPGTFRFGHGYMNDTLLRRSMELDALTELGGLLVKQTAPLLPEGAVTASETEDGVRTVRVALTQDQIPDVALSALNLGFSFLSDRWFSYGHDRSFAGEDLGAFEDYVSATSALAAGTVRWTLRGADVTFSMDAQGRLTAASGAIQVASTFWDGSIREVEVTFDLAMTDYGTSHVAHFNADDYGVSLPDWWYSDGDEMEMEGPVLTDQEWEALKDRSVALLKAQDFPTDNLVGWGAWGMPDGYLYLEIENADGSLYDCVYDADGGLLVLSTNSEWYASEATDAEGVEAATLHAAVNLVRLFLEEQNPALADAANSLEIRSLLIGEDGCQFLSLHNPEQHVYCIVRTEPSLRIEYYDGTPAD